MSHQTGIRGTVKEKLCISDLILTVFYFQEMSSLSHFSASAGMDIFESSEFQS